ncbi:RNA polymerase sigma factor [Myxococcus qinghaiensis]|uniref:RNA polymerase sigma factor n=1 Tax=Myxococcus qinghaiensis TaxID=2906758 RepID=UPI00211408E9|nr:sigma-70 family RNA polymerase sigma factor [Myxococcus qinghaiensis]
MRARPRLRVVEPPSGVPGTDFEVFARQFQPVLFAILRKYCVGIEHEVEDLVHDVLLRALLQWEHLKHWESYKQRFWLGRVAENCFLDRCRRRKSEADRLRNLLELHEEAEHIDEAAQDELWCHVGEDDVKRALGFLSPRLRLTFELYLQGMSYARIARETGVSPGTVGARLHHARLELRELLRETAERRRRERGR